MTGARRARARLENSLTADQALAIAQSDAVRAYRDVSDYAVRISLEGDGWHVDYELKDLTVKGGGPHYLIDAVAGTNLDKTYEQ
jgi:hypothetical protein